MPSRPRDLLVCAALVVLGGCGEEEQGRRGPKRALPVAGTPAPEADAPAEPAVDDDAPRDDARVRSLGPKGAVDCPVGSERRGAAPPAALESYCLRRTDTASVQHGPYRRWYPDGTVRAEGTYENGTREGTWTEYAEDGSPRSITTFHRDVRDGKWQTFHPGGALEGEGTYEDGKKSGRATFYWPDGTKKAEGTWENDVKVGESTNFHPDGTLQSRGNYVAGKKDGEWIDVDSAGRQVTSTWKDGVKVDG